MGQQVNMHIWLTVDPDPLATPYGLDRGSLHPCQHRFQIWNPE